MRALINLLRVAVITVVAVMVGVLTTWIVPTNLPLSKGILVSGTILVAILAACGTGVFLYRLTKHRTLPVARDPSDSA